jgi:glutamine synthetase
MLAAGLKGIEGNYKLPEPVELDIYHLSEAERKRLGIQELPGSLYEAVQEVEKSALVKEALGDHIFNKFLENKKIEWDAFRTHVSAYEIDRYLPIL